MEETQKKKKKKKKRYGGGGIENDNKQKVLGNWLELIFFNVLYKRVTHISE